LAIVLILAIIICLIATILFGGVNFAEFKIHAQDGYLSTYQFYSEQAKIFQPDFNQFDY